MAFDFPKRSEFGKLLKQMRVRADLTQKRLAEVTGIPEAEICRCERGLKKPWNDPLRLEAVARALGLAPVGCRAWDRFMLVALPEGKVPTHLNKIIRNPLVTAIIAKLDGMTQTELKEVLESLDAVKEENKPVSWSV